jgi:hypothetical protein
LSDNRTDYSVYTVTNKAQYHLRKAFQATKQSPFRYELFPITDYIEKNLVYNERQRCRLTTTGEIIKAICYMKTHNLF